MFDIVIKAVLWLIAVVVFIAVVTIIELSVTKLYIKMLHKVGTNTQLHVQSIRNVGFYLTLRCLDDNSEEFKVYYWLGNAPTYPIFKDKIIVANCYGHNAAFHEIIDTQSGNPEQLA